MIDRARRGRAVTALAALVFATVSCRDSTGPEPFPDADLRGSFLLVRTAPTVCLKQIDPDGAQAFVSLGLLTFDVDSARVRQQEVRVGCLRGDTLVVDQKRSFRVNGPGVIIERRDPASAAAPDSGTVSGNILALRIARADLVYERVTDRDNLHYFRVSEFPRVFGNSLSWTVGTSAFRTAPHNGVWELQLPGTTQNQGQALYLYRPVGRPEVGTYPIGAFMTAPFSALLGRSEQYGFGSFESTSGTITITESTPAHLAGSFTIDLRSSTGSTARAEGRFRSLCACD